MVMLVVIAGLQLHFLTLRMTLLQLSILLRLDTTYSWSALIVLVSGFVLWLTSEQPPGHYLGQSLFITKLLLFALVAIISLYPSMVYLKFKNGPLEALIGLSARLIWILRLEIVLLTVLIFLVLTPHFL
jgi:putative membrane protein